MCSSDLEQLGQHPALPAAVRGGGHGAQELGLGLGAPPPRMAWGRQKAHWGPHVQPLDRSGQVREGWCPRPCRTEGTGASQGCLCPPQGQRPESSCGREAPSLLRGLHSLGGNSRRTGHLVQAGCAPFSVNLLSGSACFHGDLTSEIFHLGCQMPVDEAKPPRVTKYRHDPTGSGGRASSGFRVGVWMPPEAGMQGLSRQPAWDLCCLWMGREQGGHGAPLSPTPLGDGEGPWRPGTRRGPGLSLCCTWGEGCLCLGGTPCGPSTTCPRRHSLQNRTQIPHPALSVWVTPAPAQTFNKLNPTTYHLVNRARSPSQGSDVETGGLQARGREANSVRSDRRCEGEVREGPGHPFHAPTRQAVSPSWALTRSAAAQGWARTAAGVTAAGKHCSAAAA